MVESDEASGIQVHRVERKKSKLSNARVSAISSCDVNSGGYRLISYENWVGYFTNYGGCNSSNETYYIQLRSLKKILGTWQNHKTNQWSFISTLKLELWGVAPYSDPNYPSYFATDLVNETNVTHAGPFDHTWNYYFLDHYPPNCYGWPFGYRPKYVWRVHSFTTYGKNGTTCDLGGTDTFCFGGGLCPM